MKYSAFFLTSMLLAARMANGAVITYIDFHNGNGTPGDAGWNMVQLFTTGIPPVAQSGGSLNADDGSSDLSIGNIQVNNAERGFESNHDTNANGDPVLPAWLSQYETSAAGDSRWLIAPSGQIASFSFDLTGFTSGQTVDINIWAGRYDNGSDFMDVTIDGAFSDGNVSDGFNYGQNGNNTDTVLSWTNIAVPVDETLTLNFVTNSGSRRIGVNAMQISVVPEPSSLMLLGVFGIAGALILRRRR